LACSSADPLDRPIHVRLKGREGQRCAQVASACLIAALATVALTLGQPVRSEATDLTLVPVQAEPTITASPTPTPAPTPTSTPAPTPAISLPPATPVPQFTPGPATTDVPQAAEEQHKIAASLTNGTLYKSGGSYGARRAVTVDDTRVEIEIYPLGRGPDEPMQIIARTWTPGVIEAQWFDFGDGTTTRVSTAVWRCDKPDRPQPLNRSWGDHSYEPGRYTLHAHVTTTPCDGNHETEDPGAVTTVDASIEFEMTDTVEIRVVY
jgi:hypothetical protein